MNLHPISWLVPEYEDQCDSQLVIYAHLTQDGIINGYYPVLQRSWPLVNCHLGFNDEDYFWFSDTHGDTKLTPHLFEDLQDAAQKALYTK